MSDCLVSVIVPVFNVENYLRKCIESIISQKLKKLQIILVDDGSTDHSGQICDEYALADERIEVIHKENEGVVSARHIGLSIARGEYIGFIDADDYIEPEFYDDLLKDIVENDVDFVHAGYVIESDMTRKICNQYQRGIYELDHGKADFIKTYILKVDSDLHMQYGVVSKLFKAELIKRCHALIPFSQTRGEDMLCTCVCILNSTKIFLDTTASYHYIMRTDSATHCNDMEEIIKFGELYTNFIKLFGSYGILADLREELSLYFRDCFISFLSQTMNDRNIVLYEFPDVKKLKNKKVVLYGAGKVGRDYYAQMCKYDEIEIIAWADKNYKKFEYDYKKVIGQAELKNVEFDLLVIAVLDESAADSMRRELVKTGIQEERIIWEKPLRITTKVSRWE